MKMAALFVVAAALMIMFGRWDRGSAAPTAVGRINVTATLVKATARPVAPPGRRGNASEQAWRITDRHGTTIGRLLLQCRWITSRARLCYGTLRMPLGQITVSGSSSTSFEGVYAVTGGTGVYQGAGGDMQFFAVGLRKNVLLVTVTT